MEENEISGIVISAAIEVHRALGPGLLVTKVSESKKADSNTCGSSGVGVKTHQVSESKSSNILIIGNMF